ncbi:MAG: hypothetical protein QOG01_375 [Pseudonocardiales bacterium]|jgi:NADPH:quinone reductase-like Zn-dependent oxidoreductase|nr:hypothetical protein [Pseudonocardiales bacterium]
MKALAMTAKDTAPAVVDVLLREPGPGEVRVDVEAASVNGFDLAVAAGYVWDYLPAEFPVVLGRDFAGSVGGDPVAGVVTAPGLGPGPIAERVVVDAASIVPRPEGVSAVQAAAVGLAGVTALDLVDALEVAAGDVVLVSGATGGVGAFTVQLAAARGARVVATARPGEAAEFVRGLGADEVTGYDGTPDGVTKVAHAAGDVAVLAALLPPGGRLASTLGATAEQAGRDDVTVTAVHAHYTPEKLAGLLAEVAAGRLAVPVAATYPLEKAADALAAFGGGKLGKIVVTP